ncbi:MAG: hypothetical protein JWM62_308 [Frankiales bacterium]|nr:hypothetical protein [Frankiales bacterium]
MTDEPTPARPPADDEAVGDPVCWLERVCDDCGALADGPPEPVCARCGSRSSA